MKYDLTKKPTKGALRTLSAFSSTMFRLLSKKNFDNITANEICDEAGYPRATFYNYFDDKFDLLNYCWILISEKINVDEYDEMDPDEAMYIFFDRIYELLEQNIDLLAAILKNNPENGYMWNSVRSYINFSMRNIFIHSSASDKYKIPKLLVADHYSNTLFLILTWVFYNNNRPSQSSAKEYLRYLLSNL